MSLSHAQIQCDIATGRECVILFGFSVVFMFIGETLFAPQHTIFPRLYFIWSACTAAVATSVMFYIFMSAFRYFSYPKLVMKKFTNQIEGNNIQDFVVWWQLRRHYLENDVRITGTISNVILTALFFASLVLIFFVIYIRGFWWTYYDFNAMKTISFLFILFGSILYLAENANSFSKEQLKHQQMLIREKLRIKTITYDEDDVRINDKEELIGVIDFMIKDIETTVVAIKMVGVEITPNIMLLIKGYVFSAFIAAVAASVF